MRGILWRRSADCSGPVVLAMAALVGILGMQHMQPDPGCRAATTLGSITDTDGASPLFLSPSGGSIRDAGYAGDGRRPSSSLS